MKFSAYYKLIDPYKEALDPLVIKDSVLLYVFNSEYQGKYKINSKSFRGFEHSNLKPEGEIRIAAVGDSITFGWEIDDESSAHPCMA